MNVYTAGMDDLSGAERRQVRRAISRGQRLDDPRLAAALVRHVDAYLANPARYEAVNAVVVGAAVAVGVAVASLLGGGLATGPWGLATWGLAVAAVQLLIGRPLRRSQFDSAKRRHTGSR